MLTSARGRVASLPDVSSVHALVPGANRPSGRRGPMSQTIDITLYHLLTLETGRSIENAIQSLLATGYFEVVEPIPANRPLLTPDDPSFAAQSYLNVIKATEAWDLVQNEEQLIIGIIDTGGDLSHPELAGKLYIDPLEPVDGVDNDGDGYIDNNRGWDFSGDIAAQVGSPGFVGDNNPSVPKAGLFGHGTMVAGCAAAATNNGVGIASVGKGARVLFTKHYSDDQDANASSYSSNTYLGVLYAATHGARIINCSWGSYNPSTIAQDIINYVTLDLGCLVIAAAGNSNVEAPIYPASYDNVLSVGSTTVNDERTFFSNYGRTLDLVAPGEDIYTTQYKDTYVYESGTSLSAPIVSGAAALVWSQHMDYTPHQVAEQLRVSSDASIYASNPNYFHKLGHGRLDVLAALTRHSPSVRISNQKFVDVNNQTPAPGETALLYMDFTNYLESTSPSLTATITTSSPYANILQGSFTVGTLTTGATRRNNSAPFRIELLPGLPMDEVVEILVTITDDNYEDHELLNFSIPSYLEIRENNIITSLSPNGRIGYGDAGTQSNGVGFLYNEERLLFEMGLIVGTSATDLQSNVRGIGGGYDDDFAQHSSMKKDTPGKRSYSEISGSVTSDDLLIKYQSLVWSEQPDRNFIILEYKVTNQTNAAMQDLYFGLFADWDIADQGAHDRAGWDADSRLGYVFPVTGLQLPRAGIQVLTGQPQYRALDNDPTLPGNPFGLYDGFTDDEKFTSVSTGVSRADAGSAANGGDVSHTVGSGPYSIAQGETITIAFALHAAMTQDELIESAGRADTVYNLMLKAPVPTIDITKACEGSPALLKPEGAGNYLLYKDLIGGQPIAEGTTLTIGPISRDTIFYIANGDHKYESLRVPATVEVVTPPTITALGETAFCEGGSVVLDAGEGDDYDWSSGESSKTITVSTPGSYTVQVKREGFFCASTNSQTVNTYELPDASFTTNPDAPVAGEVTTFTALETNATSWAWKVKDGGTGQGKEFSYTFPDEGSYTVGLTVTNENQCVSQSEVEVGLITGIESTLSGISIYPNPVVDDRLLIAMPSGADVTFEILDIAGHKLISMQAEGQGKPSTQEHLPDNISTVNTSWLRNGQYMLRISSGTTVSTHRFVVFR
ncbi:S8 family serine peptidase [Chryseolinea sp. T2]|uniref:S8 family serine peptidase n=1 Tax=Chryseolinea sp. T2 TaxID=3129255 RepID=UPI003078378E